MRGLVRWAIWVGGCAVPQIAAAAEMIGPPTRPSLTVCAKHGDGEGNNIEGATVILVAPEGAAASAQTKAGGCVDFIALAAGSYRVTVIGPGTEPVDGTVEIPEDGGARYDAALSLATASMQEVVVEASREGAGETRRSLTPEQVRSIPGAANDALKSLQNMPGVARAPFGVGMLVVRGAAPGDTRVYLDGQEIPQLYHFGGLTSVVATEALERIDFLPGGFGVRYGRAIGGVVDVTTRGAREDQWGGHFDADFYDASGLAEGPVGKHGKVLASARRSYVELLLPAMSPTDLTWTVAPRYYDYQLRWDPVPLENGTQPRVMAYGSDDAFTFVVDKPNEEGLHGRYLFRTAFHRLQAPVTRPLKSGWILSAVPAAGYQSLTLDGGGLIMLQGTRALGSLRAEARGPLRKRVNLLVGFDGQMARDAYAVDYEDDANSGASSPDRRMIASASYGSAAAGMYAEAEIDSLGGFVWVPGVRVDYYAPANTFTLDPRIAGRWRFAPASWVKGYAGLYHQPPQFHEWDDKLGNPDLVPARAFQTGLGGGHEIDAGFRVEGEVFWKWIDDLPVQKGGDPSDPTAHTTYSNEGMGRSYGFEGLIRRDFGSRLTGWVAYTLSRSERASPYQSGWKTYYYDQTHVLTAVASRKLGRNWSIGTRFRWVTGSPTSVVEEAVYDVDEDRYLPVPGFRHDERLPTFHQLDIRIDKRWKWSGWTLEGYLDVQNVYARLNPERVRYSFDYGEKAYITGLPIFPSIGIRGEF